MDTPTAISSRYKLDIVVIIVVTMSATDPQVVDREEFVPMLDYQFLGDDYTVERKRKFIEGMIKTHTVYRAATIAGVSKKTAYNWYHSDPQFAEAWDEAEDSSTDRLESSMYERAVANDTISGIFLLKKYRPAFRDKIQVDVEILHSEIESLAKQVEPRQLQPITTEFINGEYQVQQLESLTVVPDNDSSYSDNPTGNSVQHQGSASTSSQSPLEQKE